MTNNSGFFEQRAEKISAKISEYEKRSIRLSILRLLIFTLAVGVAIWVFAKEYPIYFILASIFLFISFIFLCFVHSSVQNQTEFYRYLYTVNAGYIARINGDFKTLKEIAVGDLKSRGDIEDATDIFAGRDFYVENHDYCIDLDLFGNRSLFSLYNVSETAFGRRAFAGELLYACERRRSIGELELRQQAVAELASKPGVMMAYQARAKQGRLQNYPQALVDFSASGKQPGIFAKIIMCILPFLWLVPIVLFMLGMTKFTKAAVLGCIALNLIFWFVCILKNSKYFDGIDSMLRQIKAIRDLLERLENAEFESEYLKRAVYGDSREEVPYSQRLKSLEKAILFASFRSQPIMAFLINIFFPLDWFVVTLLGKWAEDYGSDLSKILYSMGDIEALMCAAQVTYSSAVHSYPNFIRSDAPSDNAVFEADTMTHPLLDPKKAVANSVSLKSNIALITGSNMSGKTTLIRTVGVCTILAYTGAPVPCKHLTLGRMRIVSSMRIVDSIEDNMSTFKAELVRISGIVRASKTTMPLLFLIDEIFRGTNSDDRTEGALTVLRVLSAGHICGLMTTHDYALVDKTEGQMPNIAYYHFSESYTDTGIVFDYKLTPGISRQSNAKFLMRLVGIE